jgi:sec-independent protein translocase protein TatA
MGGQEIVLLLVLGVLLFGGSQLPRLGRTVGRTVSEVRKGVRGIEDDVEDALEPTRPAKPEPERVSPPQRITSAPSSAPTA